MKISTLPRWLCLASLIFSISLLSACGGGGGGGGGNDDTLPTPPPFNNGNDNEGDDQDNTHEEPPEEVVDPTRQVVTTLDMNQADLTQTLAEPHRRWLFVLSGPQKWLKVIDMMTGDQIAHIDFEYQPERIAISPNGEHVYVAHITAAHSSYRWEEDQQGYITPIDPETLEAKSSREIDIDPFDMVALDDGSYVVTSGSGQWTHIKHYNHSGSLLTQGWVYQRSNLSLHPSQEAVYVATNGISPSKFYRTNLGGVHLSEDLGSPHGGPSRVFGRVWPSTNGDLVLSRGGDVFNDSNLQVNRSLTHSNQTIEHAFNDYFQRVMIAVTSDNKVLALNGITLDLISTIELAGEIESAYLAGPYAFYLTHVGDTLTLIREGHPCPDCRNNTAPLAKFSVSPEVIDTGTTLLLDANESTDTETPNELKYRWDLNGNGEWDTEFNSNPLFEHRFDVPGEYLIRLQVRDPQGLRNTQLRIVNVTQGTDVGTPIDGSEVVLPSSIDYSLDHPERGLFFQVDESNRRLYFMDAESGQAIHYFSFNRYPGRMALNPEGDKLYLALNPEPQVSYQYDNHPGHVAVFDLNDRVYNQTIATEVSPYDLVVTRNNKLIVSTSLSYNGQLVAYNATTGGRLGALDIQGRSRLTLHPTLDRLYIVPGSMYNRIVIVNTAGSSISQINATNTSANIGKRVWVTADGRHLITQGGYLLDSNTLSEAAFIGEDWNYLDAAFSDPEQGIFTVVHNNKAVTYNEVSLQEITRTNFIGLVGGYYQDGAVYYHLHTNEGPSLVQGIHPCPNCASNTAPQASFSYEPAPATIADTIVFDGSASSDVEDGTGVFFRWAIDGQWQSGFSASSEFNHRFTLPGDYQVRLQVRDSGGLIDSDEQTLSIEVGSADAIPVEDAIAGVLDFPFEAFTENLNAGKVYAADRERRRVYTIDLPSRMADHYYEFTVSPIKLALSADGESLFVLLEEFIPDNYETRHYLAIIDLVDEAHTNTLGLDFRAANIVATHDGRLALTQYGSWERKLIVLDPSSGAQIEAETARGEGHILRHPTENWLYVSYSTSYPTSIERYNLDGSQLTLLNSSPSSIASGHQIWIVGADNVLIGRSGNIFNGEQLTLVGGLDDMHQWNWINYLIDDTEQGRLFAVHYNRIAIYDRSSLELLESENYATHIMGVLPYQDHVYYILPSSNYTDIIAEPDL